jgi:hypothetical protein
VTLTSHIAGGLALCSAMLSAWPAVSETDTPLRPPSALCDACRNVCAEPLDHEDDLLDESTNRYLPTALRGIATGAAIDLARELMRIHRDYEAGHFGVAYEASAGDIGSLAGKRAESDPATSAEVRSLKRVRAALYADTVVGLRALAADAPSQEFLAMFRASEAVLDGVLSSLSSAQPMRAAERLAVCRVLAFVP